MRVVRTDPFKRDFQKLPDRIKKKTETAVGLLINNPYHPSLRVKKVKGDLIKGFDKVFEVRITRDYRFFFLIESDSYIFLCCGSHEEYLK
jgi:mRNA-degrading endonuclease YafQ of YafQ-DinJ toxin-antitoxin module